MGAPVPSRYAKETPEAPELFIERIGGVTWRLRKDDPPTWWRRVLAEPDDWLRDPSRHLRNSRDLTLARVPAPEPGERGLVLRRLNYGRWRPRLRDLFRPSRARRAFRHTLALETARLPVARALAVADVRLFRWPVRAYVVSEEIAGAQTLAGMLRQPLSVTRHMVEALARVIGQLHGAGFIHGDLKASNILFDTEGKPWLIDFDGVRRFRRVTFARTVREIARLAVGVVEAGGEVRPRQARHFLRRYCAERGAEISVQRLPEVWRLVNSRIQARPPRVGRRQIQST